MAKYIETVGFEDQVAGKMIEFEAACRNWL
jgi:hypothetical protein